LSTERCDSHYGVACLGMVGHQCPLPNPSNNNNKNNTFAIANDNAHTPKNPKPYITHCHPHFQTPPSLSKPNPLQLAVAAAIGQTNIYFRSFSFKQCAKAPPPHFLTHLTIFIHTYIYIYIFFHASHFKLKIRKKHYGSRTLRQRRKNSYYRLLQRGWRFEVGR